MSLWQVVPSSILQIHGEENIWNSAGKNNRYISFKIKRWQCYTSIFDHCYHQFYIHAAKKLSSSARLTFAVIHWSLILCMADQKCHIWSMQYNYFSLKPLGISISFIGDHWRYALTFWYLRGNCHPRPLQYYLWEQVIWDQIKRLKNIPAQTMVTCWQLPPRVHNLDLAQSTSSSM